MIIEMFSVGPFMENTYVVADEKTGQAIIVDPGGENHKILAYLEEKQLKATAIVCTHGHIDHIAGVVELRKALDVPFLIHKADEILVRHAPESARMFGMQMDEVPEIDGYIEEGKAVELGDITLEVLHTPGHSAGGVCIKGNGFVLAGDTLFNMSVGRTDLPGGSYETLIRSIHEKLMTLPDETEVYCGHGPATTIGFERENNPFLG